jgi:hypothetical protein
LKRGAVLAPGYGGTAQQPILRALASALERFGIVPRSVTFRTRGTRPSKDYASEIEDLQEARDLLRVEGHDRIALVGRSFGGRISAFLAEREPPDALIILGHPIAPPKRPRPRDEAALAAMTCPTLVVQGERDELGPLAVLERIAANNPRIDLVRIAGAGHDFGPGEPEAVATAARWLDSVLR